LLHRNHETREGVIKFKTSTFKTTIRVKRVKEEGMKGITRGNHTQSAKATSFLLIIGSLEDGNRK